MAKYLDASGLNYFWRKVVDYLESNPSKGQAAQVVKRVNDTLYIGSKYDADNDIIISFQKCMANNLMTFYKVGLAANTQKTPDSDPTRSVTTVFNQTSSDNIGPISIDGSLSSDFVGGNHTWTYGSFSAIKTAETASFAFYADGAEIDTGDVVWADTVEVHVTNYIYDPRVAPTDSSTTMLSTRLCVEKVVYRVENGNILVNVSHTYDSAAIVSKYYGMQSMFSGESYIMTPEGAYPSPTAIANVSSFNKADYPDFNRYIECNADVSNCQSAYLFPIGLGDHSMIASGNVYIHASSKSYHVLMKDASVVSGGTYSWCGLYTWFTPILNDNNVFVYKGSCNGQDVLFIDVKTACDCYVEVPEFTGRKYAMLEQSSTITVDTEITAAGFHIAATGTGTAVLVIGKFESQQSGGGSVTIADVTGLQTALDGKQATLTSTTALGGVNGQTLNYGGAVALTGGDIPLSAGSSTNVSGAITQINHDLLQKQGALTFGTGLSLNGNIVTVNTAAAVASGDTGYTTGAQVATALAGKQDTIAKGSITIATSDWSSNACTVTATGVSVSNTVIVSPDSASMADYAAAGVQCTAQGANTLTFTCTTTPTSSLTINFIAL